MTPDPKGHEDRENRGISVLNDAPFGQTATIAATGLGRSGTTMVSRVMQAVGVDMGRNLTPQSNEDKKIQQLLKAGDVAGFTALCRELDAGADVWGFKCPALRGGLVRFVEPMRNPRVIIIFRDILAISMRNNISIGHELLPAMRTAIKGYQALLDQVAPLSAPTLMISYEKALQNPEHTVSAIARFCGRSVSDEEIGRIANLNVVNGDPRYLG